MRRLSAIPVQPRPSQDHKQRSSMPRKQAPLRQLHPSNPPDIKPVKPFELAGDQNRDLFRQVIREEMEQYSSQLRSEITQLRDMVEAKPDRKGLDNYLNARLQQQNIENQARYQEIRSLVGHLERELRDRVGAVENSMEAVRQGEGGAKTARKNTVESSKLQMLEENVEILFQRMEGMGEGRRSLGRRRQPQQTPNPNSTLTPADLLHDFQRQLRSLKNQLKLDIAQLSQGLDTLSCQLQQHQHQLTQKLSLPDISQTLHQLTQKSTQNSLTLYHLTNSINQLHDQHGVNQRAIAKLQQKSHKSQQTFESQLATLRLDLQEQMNELAAQTQQRIAGVVQSYNGNFQQIDENTTQLRQMLSDLLGVNNLITRKLQGSSSLNDLAIESAIQDLNDQVISTLHSNNRKINEIGDKEFEVEHELKMMKEVLAGLRRDWEGRRGRGNGGGGGGQREEERYSLCESDRKGRRQHNGGGGVTVSPYLMSPRLEECRFRRNEGMYQAVGGRYNSTDRKVYEVQEQDEYYEGYAPSLSEELASIQ